LPPLPWLPAATRKSRRNGFAGSEPERRLMLREDLQEWLRQSSPSFPSNTLGL